MKILKPSHLILVLLLSPCLAQAETRYISDKIYVPLRVGDGAKFRIIHRGLPSGTALELLETSEASGYSRVRTSSGTEGWLPTQYLVSTPVARSQLDAANTRAEQLAKTNQELRNKLASTSESNAETSATVEALQKENAALSRELDEIKRVSANAIKLDGDNRRLLESNQKLSSEVDVLKTDNVRLRENKENEFFLNGAFAVLIGVMITLIVPRMIPKKRSDWG